MTTEELFSAAVSAMRTAHDRVNQRFNDATTRATRERCRAAVKAYAQAAGVGFPEAYDRVKAATQR